MQIFTPTPSTYSSLMYYTELDPFTRQPLFVEKDPRAPRAPEADRGGQTGRSRRLPPAPGRRDRPCQRPQTMSYRLFAVTAPGLEPFTPRRNWPRCGLKASRPKLPPAPMSCSPGSATGRTGAQASRRHKVLAEEDEVGGLAFEASLDDLYRANLHLRTASRILARLGDFYAAAFSELRKKASRLPWERYLRPGQPVALRVTCHKSRLYHSDAVARAGGRGHWRPAGQAAQRLVKFDEAAAQLPQLVVVRLVTTTCTISLDTSGALLHRRGYRLETAKAPLRETLAAGLLLASGWDRAAPLLDPFCGSGTIPIEAALLARRIAPGKNRRFAFMDWPGFDPVVWQASCWRWPPRRNCPPRRRSSWPPTATPARSASPRPTPSAPGCWRISSFACRAVSAIEPPPGPGWVVTNPPYGVRVSAAHDLRNLYAQFGNVLRAPAPAGRWACCVRMILVGHTRLRFQRSLALVNGGIRVRLYIGAVG